MDTHTYSLSLWAGATRAAGFLGGNVGQGGSGEQGAQVPAADSLLLLLCRELSEACKQGRLLYVSLYQAYVRLQPSLTYGV